MDGLLAPAPRSRLALPRRSLRHAGDDRLVAQIRSGDGPAARNAFEILYDRHHRGVLAFCRHMLGSLEEAEDAVQHTFSSAYRALLADDRQIALRAWLYAIARNRCLSMLAARREQVALDDVEAVLPSTAGLAQEVEQRTDLRELLGDMQRLPVD
ncbi:MAG TPA: sigma factor, partial [Solirubrobacteraceae bacterium]|nr:sigma factor [Solirubrobacteraceae bacterium]